MIDRMLERTFPGYQFWRWIYRVYATAYLGRIGIYKTGIMSLPSKAQPLPTRFNQHGQIDIEGMGMVAFTIRKRTPQTRVNRIRAAWADVETIEEH